MHPYRRTLSALATTALMSSGLTVGVAAAANAEPHAAQAVEVTEPILSGLGHVGTTLQLLLPPDLVLLSPRIEWLRDGAQLITGTTGMTSYTPTASDVGHTISARVTTLLAGIPVLSVVTNAVDVLPAPTDPTDPTDPTETLRLLVEPVITGLTTVGSTLTATNPADGDWSLPGVQESIQWFRDGAAIPGADDWTYALQPADLGKTVHAVITGSLLGLLPVEKVLPPKQVEQLEALFTPLMAGLAKVGETLSVAKPGDAGWNHPDVTSTIQWFRDNVAVPGATGWTFPVTPEDAGAQLTAVITGTLGSVGIPVAVPGKTVEEQEITATTKPAITPAQPKVGDTLTASEPVWSVTDGVETTYQWERGGQPIAGATGTSYTTTAADAGKAIRVVATGTKGEGDTEQTGTSASDAVTVAATTLTPTRRPSIAPATDVDHGEVLTADPGAWGTEVAPTFSYQWLRDGVPIDDPAARQRSYTVQVADVTAQLSVVVKAVRDGASGSATTAPVTVDKLVARTTAKLARKRIRQGQVAVLRIKTRAVGVSVPGKVKIFDGKKRIRTVRVGDGVKKVRIKKLGAGVHKLKVVHSGNQYVAPSRDKVRLVVKKRSRR